MTDSITGLKGTWEEVRAHDAELAGRRVWLRVLPASDLPPASEVEGSLTATQLMALPYEDRARYLRKCAAHAEKVYRDHPQLLEFEASGEEDLFDETPTR